MTLQNLGYEMSRVFPVSPERLSAAFIDPSTLRSIWGVSSITVDARPGGHACAILDIGGENWDFTITYQEVDSGNCLRWVVHFDRFPAKETRVTLKFMPLADGAELTVRMENFESPEERDANQQAWRHALETLAGMF